MEVRQDALTYVQTSQQKNGEINTDGNHRQTV